MKSLTIKRFGRLGDIINTVPLIRAAQRNDIEVSYCCEQRYRPFIAALGCNVLEHCPSPDVSFDDNRGTIFSHRFYRDSDNHPVEIVQSAMMKLGLGTLLEWDLPTTPSKHPDDFILVMPSSQDHGRTFPSAVTDELVDRLREIGPVVVDRGERPLLEMFDLVKNATVLVSPDSGQVHAARAFETPVVGIFDKTDPEKRGPYQATDKCLRVIDVDRAVGLVSAMR